MANVKPDEISAILRQQLSNFKSESELEGESEFEFECEYSVLRSSQF